MKTKTFDLKAIVAGAMFFCIVITFSSCKKDNPGADQVWMQNMAFNPATLTISNGSTVTWTNKDNMTHNVTSDSGVFISGNIAPGGTFSYHFTSTGKYPYRCTIHAGMTATIIVQ